MRGKSCLFEIIRLSLGHQIIRLHSYSFKLILIHSITTILELIASTVSKILANRFVTTPLPYSYTERKYDQDGNVVETEETGPFLTPTYYGHVEKIPATIFERLFRLISSTPHAALLLWHQCIQGILSVIYFIRKIKHLQRF